MCASSTFLRCIGRLIVSSDNSDQDNNGGGQPKQAKECQHGGQASVRSSSLGQGVRVVRDVVVDHLEAGVDDSRQSLQVLARVLGDRVG